MPSEASSVAVLRELLRLTRKPSLAAAALQLLSTEGDLHATDLALISSLPTGHISDASASLFVENLCFKNDQSSPDVANFILTLAKMGDASCLLWLLDDEFDPWNRSPKTPDGVMKEVTAAVFSALGAAKVTAQFLALLPAEDVEAAFKGDDLSMMKDEQKLVRIVQKMDSKKNSIPKIRAAALLMLDVLGASEEIISHCLGVDSNSLVEDVLIKALVASKDHGKLEDLSTILADESRDHVARIQAAWILNRCGQKSGRFRQILESVAGFPLPWRAAVSLPQAVREDILREYAPGAERGTELALRLEASLLPASSYTDYDNEQEHVEWFNDFPVVGPIDCSELHGTGGGSYRIYKIYVNPAPHFAHMQIPEGMIAIIPK